MVEITFTIPEFTLVDRKVCLRGILSSLDEIKAVVCRWDEIHKWDKNLGIVVDPKLDTEIQFYRQILAYHQAHPLLPLSDTKDTATLYAIQDSQICGYVLFAYSGRIHYDRPNVMHVNLYGSSPTIRQLLFDGMLRFLSKNLIKFFAFPLAQQFWFPMPDVWELEVFYCRIGQRHPKDWEPLINHRDPTRHFVNLDFFYDIKNDGSIQLNEISFVFPSFLI